MTSDSKSRLTRWFFPSIKDILFLGYLFGPSLVNESGVLYDSDTGWHIRNGEHILQTGSWPHSDYFSYTNYGKPWFAWEWLADVTMATIHKYAGLNGVAIWADLTFALTFTLLFWWTARRGGNVLVCLLFSCLAGFAGSVHRLARPHLFTMLLVLTWYVLLEHVQSQGMMTSRIRRKVSWAFPTIILVWTNLHGGFVVGLILLFIFAFGNYLTTLTCNNPEIRVKSKSLSWHFTKMALLCLAVTLINPYGYHVHKHIFDSYLHSQYLVDRITEFASPNFHTTVVIFFELIVLSSIVILGVSYKRLNFIEVGLILFWTHMALFSVRHVPLYTLIIVPVLVSHFTEYLKTVETSPGCSPWVGKNAGGFNRYSGNILGFERQFKGYFYPALASAVMIGIALNQGYVMGCKVLNAGFDSKQFPVKAGDFIERQSFGKNFVTTDSWGGYMIYRFHPRLKVFFDGRSDMYGAEFVREYESLINLEYSWKSVLDRYKIAWVLLPVNYGLASALKELPGWESVYDDHFAIIFVKRGG